MPTDVVMPQMGESIFEGTITKWLKKPGDMVQRDEPLFEISTDKVDAEIPSPASGRLTEVKATEGSTVQINTVVAVIADAENGSVPATAAAAAQKDTDAPAPAMPAAREAAPGAGTDVVMPQMGESILEGTITKWLKKTGETVERDEPLFEISTDKVDAEIPSPESGVLSEIRIEAGGTVHVNAVVAVIQTGAASSAPAPTPAPAPLPASAPLPAAPAPAAKREPDETPAAPSDGQSERVRSSPLVRKIAKENSVDLEKVPPTGAGGRVTKEDILGFMAKGEAKAPESPAAAKPAAAAAAASNRAPAIAPAASVPAGADSLVPMSRMRSIIAQRMVESKHTSAHVHTVFKIDMTRIVRIREREKSKYEQRNGVKLTYMPFIARAVVAMLRKMPIVNASIEGGAIRYHQHVNLGIAVALDWGLIVPVLRQAEERSFLGIARGIAEVAERARTKKLSPDEVGSGTFTITNPGIFGEQFGTPVINQPESAILGVGGLFKEAVVVTDENGNDALAVRSIMRLTLGFDHRIIDGADAGRFMADLKKHLEGWNEDIG